MGQKEALGSGSKSGRREGWGTWKQGRTLPGDRQDIPSLHRQQLPTSCPRPRPALKPSPACFTPQGLGVPAPPQCRGQTLPRA